MNGFWELLTRPALEAAGAREIVEIGSEGGKNTRRLLDWCERHGARLHVIEPEPGYDPDALAAAYPKAFVFHPSTSLEILPKLGALDAVLIDGDHNWYTVYHELLEIEKTHAADFPLAILHDMEWPFARRDMYYAPARIPGEHRHEYQRAGAQRGQSELVPGDGIAPELYKATHEGGPRNGVRTAVEDFIAQSTTAFRPEIVPVDFGLGLLAPQTLLERCPALTEIFGGLTDPAFEHRLMLHMETRRTDDMIAMQSVLDRTRFELAIVVEDLGLHEAELRRHEVEVARLRKMLEESHLEARELRSRVEGGALVHRLRSLLRASPIAPLLRRLLGRTDTRA